MTLLGKGLNFSAHGEMPAKILPCPRRLNPCLLTTEEAFFPLESFEEKGNADVALEHVLSCHFWGVGILGDLRNKEFPQFIRALHIFKLIFQSSDTVG